MPQNLLSGISWSYFGASARGSTSAPASHLCLQKLSKGPVDRASSACRSVGSRYTDSCLDVYAKQWLQPDGPCVLLVFGLAEVGIVAQVAAGLLDVECISDIAM